MKRHFLLSFMLCSVLGMAQKQVLFSTEMIGQGGCYRIPSVVKAPNGTLIAVADERHNNCGDLLYNKNINIVQRLSKDGGKSWSPIKAIIDFPDGASASDPSMVVDKVTGEVFLFYNYMNHNTGKEFRFHFVKSSDGGASWSEPRDITDDIAPKDWEKDFKFITSGLGVQNEQGWLLNTLVRLKDGVYVFGTKDHGRTWFRTTGVAKDADETNIVTLGKNEWLLNSRIKNLGHRRFYTSTDEGKTWQKTEKTDLIDPTCNASTLKYGRFLVFSNLHSSEDRRNLGIKYSKDHGRTWHFHKTIEENDAAYSVLVPLSRKKLGILYETEDYNQIVFDTFKFSRTTPKK